MKVWLFALVLGLACYAPLRAQESGYIANNMVTLAHITPAQAYRIFMVLQRYWDESGHPITVILPPPESVSFRMLARDGLRMDSLSYYELIQARLHVGKGVPIIAPTENMVVVKVSETPNSIGYYYGKIAVNTGLRVRIIPLSE